MITKLVPETIVPIDKIPWVPPAVVSDTIIREVGRTALLDTVTVPATIATVVPVTGDVLTQVLVVVPAMLVQEVRTNS